MAKRVGPSKYLPPQDAVIIPPRHWACPRYGGCLVLAAARHWRSWSCRSCPMCPDDARIEVLRSSRVRGRAVLRAG